ncbi:hypothetical protein SOVF_164990 [Spinacia oleracea]|nr:hypothetical protein SOVF_164990 [Spinacia oleracea]
MQEVRSLHHLHQMGNTLSQPVKTLLFMCWNPINQTHVIQQFHLSSEARTHWVRYVVQQMYRR